MSLNANDFQALTYSAKPSVLVFNSAAQTFTTATLTAVVYDTDQDDRWGMHDPSSNTDRLTIQEPGIYFAMANIIFASNATGIRRLVLESYNAADSLTNRYAFQSFTAVNGDTTAINVAALTDPLIQGDFLRVKALQSSGGDLDSGTASTTNVSPNGFGAAWHSRG